VSGLFGKLETVNIPKAGKYFRAVFQTEKGSVGCDLTGASPGEMNRWRAMRPNQPFAVRGIYGRAAMLSRCQLLEPTAPADAKYAGKEIELTGLVAAAQTAQEYPTLLLEPETNSLIEIRCVFRKDDLPNVKKVPVGTLVTVQGKCSGRQHKTGRTFVQLDNCRFVTTTGPAPEVPRCDVRAFCREYEEDLRPFFLPERGLEDRHETPLTVTGLSVERKANPASLNKYLHRVLTVSGRLGRRGDRQLVLESPETDQPLKVTCHFTTEQFNNLADLKEYQVRGYCTEVGMVMRLDNCEGDASVLRSAVPVLTADYLPHNPGNMLTYDLAAYPPAVRPAVVVRQVWFQREGGLTETVITNSARFTGQTLLTIKPGAWLTYPRTKKARLPGPVYLHKTLPKFIEFGQRAPRGQAQEPLAPELKLGSKAGDSWELVRKNSKHVFTVERFETWRGRPSVVIKEVMVTPLSTYRESEIRHVYVKGLGEVERREWLRVTSTETKLVAEKRLILPEDMPVSPGKGPKDKKPDKGGKDQKPPDVKK
jgi:hypothetical protein